MQTHSNRVMPIVGSVIAAAVMAGFGWYLIRWLDPPAVLNSAPMDDEAALQGEWQAVEVRVGGKTSSEEDEDVRSTRIAFSGREMVNLSISGEQKRTFKLETEFTPKHIDITFRGGRDKGKTVFGIYKLEDDRLTICFAPGDKESIKRPLDFQSGKDDGQVILVLKRSKEKWIDPRVLWPDLQPAANTTAKYFVQVGSNVQASAAGARDQHAGCVIAADPTRPERLIVASLRNNADTVGYYSHDGGETWHFSCKRPHGNDEVTGDEDVVFGPDGAIYFVNMRHRREVTSTHQFGAEGVAVIDLARSLDGGKSWEERGAVPRFIDRPCLATDCTNGPHRGQLYCQANIEEPIVYMSEDGAQTFNSGLLLRPTIRSARPSHPAVLPDGAVLVTSVVLKGGADPHNELPLWRSIDAGRTFEPLTPNLAGRWKHQRLQSGSFFNLFYPQLAVDPGSARFAGSVYCVWRDGRNEAYILFNRSSDGGATWSVPVVLSEQALGMDAGPDYTADVPAMAVNKGGVVAVTWYDRRGLPKSAVGPGNLIPAAEGYDARLRVSCDGGKTWLPSVRLNEVPMTGELIEARGWAGLAASADGRFHAAWIGDSTGRRQVWTAAVDVKRSN
jgi:uncharacterized protein (TIGR03067 family)